MFDRLEALGQPGLVPTLLELAHAEFVVRVRVVGVQRQHTAEPVRRGRRFPFGQKAIAQEHSYRGVGRILVRGPPQPSPGLAELTQCQQRLAERAVDDNQG